MEYKVVPSKKKVSKVMNRRKLTIDQPGIDCLGDVPGVESHRPATDPRHLTRRPGDLPGQRRIETQNELQCW